MLSKSITYLLNYLVNWLPPSFQKDFRDNVKSYKNNSSNRINVKTFIWTPELWHLSEEFSKRLRKREIQ